MTDAYQIHDARYLFEVAGGTAADALVVAIGPVPDGRVWTLRAIHYNPSVAETRTVWATIQRQSGNAFSFTRPFAILLSSIIPCAFITEGMEIKMYPGESVYVYRDVATAGSTMALRAVGYDTELPYYSFEEPQKIILKKSQRRSSIWKIPSAGIGGDRGGREIPGGGGGGPGEPQPY